MDSRWPGIILHYRWLFADLRTPRITFHLCLSMRMPRLYRQSPRRRVPPASAALFDFRVRTRHRVRSRLTLTTFFSILVVRVVQPSPSRLLAHLVNLHAAVVVHQPLLVLGRRKVLLEFRVRRLLLLRLVLRRRQVFAAPCRRPPGRVLPGLRDINRGRRGRTSFTRPTHDSDEGAHWTSGHAVKHDDAAQQREGHPVGGVR